jgi:hypothetical protein
MTGGDQTLEGGYEEVKVCVLEALLVSPSVAKAS